MPRGNFKREISCPLTKSANCVASLCRPGMRSACSASRLPSPFEAVVGQLSERDSVPGNEKLQCRLVAGDFVGVGSRQKIAFCPLPFPIPAVIANERSNRVRGGLRRSKLHDDTRSHLCSHRPGYRTRVLATQTEGFQKALSWRRSIGAQLLHAISDHDAHLEGYAGASF